MRVNTLLLAATAVGIFGGAAACGVVGPSCLERQERGNVTSMVGVVEPGQVVSTSVPYDLRGSENDISITWDGRGTAGGPHIHVYATNTGCSEFVPPPPGSGSDVDPPIRAHAGSSRAARALRWLPTHGLARRLTPASRRRMN
jgi:hypothetical protein